MNHDELIIPTAQGTKRLWGDLPIYSSLNVHPPTIDWSLSEGNINSRRLGGHRQSGLALLQLLTWAGHTMHSLPYIPSWGWQKD